MSRPHSICAFTLIEYMIMIVIVGLLFAMAAPAFMQVRNNSREKHLKAELHAGRRITEDDRAFLRQMQLKHDEHSGRITEGRVEPERGVATQYNTIEVDGVWYYLIPKGTAFQEMSLKGEPYIMVPVEHR